MFLETCRIFYVGVLRTMLSVLRSIIFPCVLRNPLTLCYILYFIFQSELESTREEVNNIRATKEVLEKDKSDLVQQKDKLTSEKESLSQENNRLKQDLQRALSEKKTKSEVVEDKKEVNPQDDDKKVDADDSLNDREPLPVAAAVKFKTDESAPKIVSQDKKDVSDDDSPTNKGKEDKAVVGDEISAKIVGQSVSDDKLNMIVDAAEEAKRRDPSA